MGVSEPTIDRDAIDRDVELGRAAHRRLVTALEARNTDGRLDPRAGTALPGWTVGHLLTHLARNADGHRRMIEGAGRGDVVEQYEGGVEGRGQEIEDGAGRALAVLIEDVATSSAALEAAWEASDWTGFGRRTLGSQTQIGQLPFLRAREVEIHHVDLGLGYTFADLDPLYLRLELSRLGMSWQARQPMGMTPLPDAALALDPPTRLAWFMGRIEVDGLAPAGIF